MTEATNTKFLGLELNKYMNWKNHIENVLKKNEQCVVRNVIHVPYQTNDYTQDDLFCLLSLNNGLWHYILGKFNRN
jgi:hypothetical protein